MKSIILKKCVQTSQKKTRETARIWELEMDEKQKENRRARWRKAHAAARMQLLQHQAIQETETFVASLGNNDSVNFGSLSQNMVLFGKIFAFSPECQFSNI
jgi:hypothetical protein